jgi:C1A family cysteine protease
MESVAWYGWVKDEPDDRDKIYQAAESELSRLPDRVDLRYLCPPVYVQGHIGSCSANAIAAAIEIDEIKEKKRRAFVPSRLFLYYNERLAWGTLSYDSGAPIRLGIKCVAKQGDCPEELWPYNIRKFRLRPPEICYARARRYRAVRYYRIPRDLAQMKACLASGFPFVFGFKAFESFEGDDVAKTGVLAMPRPGEKKVGDHAVLAVGYQDDTGSFIARNSWGEGWGMDGYFFIPYDYLLEPRLSSDFWTITLVR